MTDLATIRRAYRYVVAYERRILDMIERVDKAVVEAGFERRVQFRWQPLYRALPSREWPTQRWAWDHVPVYVSRFQWLAGAENARGSRYVLVDHVADTSFEAVSKQREPDPLEDLEPADESRSILRWTVINLDQVIDAPTWRLPWVALLSKVLKVPATQLLPSHGTSSVIRHQALALKMQSWALDLSTVEGAADVDGRFIVPLRSALDSPLAAP